MPTIHINTDLLRQLGQSFDQLNDQIQNQLQPHIHSLASQVEGDWQGHGRYTYDDLYNNWVSSVKQVIQHGEDLSRHLQSTAEQFDHIDHGA